MGRVWRVEVATSADDGDGKSEAELGSMAEDESDGIDQRGKTIALSGGRMVAWKDRTRSQSGYHGSRRLQESRCEDETLMSYHQKLCTLPPVSVIGSALLGAIGKNT